MALISREALLLNTHIITVDGDLQNAISVVTAEDIQSAPAVDAVHVVRCKDCKHYEKYDDWDRNASESVECHECVLLGKDLGENGFCSRGARNDGGGEE